MKDLLLGLLLGAGIIIVLDMRDTLMNHKEAVENLEDRLIPIEEALIVEVEEN